MMPINPHSRSPLTIIQMSRSQVPNNPFPASRYPWAPCLATQCPAARGLTNPSPASWCPTPPSPKARCPTAWWPTTPFLLPRNPVTNNTQAWCPQLVVMEHVAHYPTTRSPLPCNPLHTALHPIALQSAARCIAVPCLLPSRPLPDALRPAIPYPDTPQPFPLC